MKPRRPDGGGLASNGGWCHALVMQTVTLDHAQRHLAELVRDLATEREVVITAGDKPVARLVSAAARPSLREIMPASVGAVLRPFPSPDDDLLGEMRGAA